jgi:DNA-binding NtrC family response regulator
VLATPTSKSLSADDLVNFDRFIARQLLVGLEGEIETLTSNSVAWIYEHLGPDYSWPGNIRELEQCVRSVMIRGSYSPPSEGDS